MNKPGFRIWLESSGLEAILSSIRSRTPFLKLDAYETKEKIELMLVEVPEVFRGMGKGTEIIKTLQDYARSVGKPIVIRPEAEKGRKGDLDRFYRNLGFVHNKGRSMDFTLSSPTASTMYWRPE
jgi:GNAT superfamily N-acetyltransferase